MDRPGVVPWSRVLTEVSAGFAAFAFIAFGEITRLLGLARLPEPTSAAAAAAGFPPDVLARLPGATTGSVAGFSPDPFTLPKFDLPLDLLWTRDELAAAFAVTVGPDAELVQSLLLWHILIDVVFAVALARLLFVLLVRLGLPSRLAPPTSPDDDGAAGPRVSWLSGLLPRWRALASRLLPRPDAWSLTIVYLVADLTETLLALVVTLARAYRNVILLNLISAASAVKWLSLGLIAVVVLLRLWGMLRAANANGRFQPEERAALSPWVRIVPIVVLVVAFVVLMALPGGSALTQLPDILRAGVERLHGVSGAGELAAGILFLLAPLLLAGAAWLAAWIATAQPAHPPPQFGPRMSWWWPVLAGILPTAVIAVTLIVRDDHKAAAWAWVAVPLAVVALAGLARWSATRSGNAPVGAALFELEPLALAPAFSVRRRGVVAASLAATVVIAASLGLTRAALPPALLGIGSSETADLYPALLVVSLCGAVLTPVAVEAGRWAVRHVGWAMAAVAAVRGMTDVVVEWTRRGRANAALAAGVGMFALAAVPIALAVSPGRVAPALSTTGVIVVAFGFAALFSAVLTQASLRTPPWAALQHLRVRNGQLSWIGYLVAVWLVSSLVGGPAGYHDARTQPRDAADSPTMDATITAWIAAHTGDASGPGGDSSRCTTQIDGREVTPLILVAGPGGGIRAAYWTAAAMDALFSPAAGVVPSAACASNVFAFAGASGGSVGGAVRLLTVPDDAALGHVQAMAQDRALAANIAALFFRDFPQALFPASDLWHDRAEVHERAWMEDAPVFTVDGSGDPGRPVASARLGEAWSAGAGDGAGDGGGWPGVLLGAASINDGCRAFTTTWAGTVPDGNGCAARDADPSYVLTAAHDLRLGLVDPRTVDDDAGPVPADLPAVTGALLSARFPYVSPSGAVRRGPAPEVVPEVLYLADGGFYDNTALLGLLQVWDGIEAEVAAHNAGVVGAREGDGDGAGAGAGAGADEGGGGGGVLIEPWLVYLPNGFEKGDDVPNTNRPRELAAPISSVVQRAGQVAVGETALLQAADIRFSGALPGMTEWLEPRLAGPEAAEADLAVPGEALGGSRVVVIRPRANDPGLTAPLGWVLAPSSQAALDRALEAELGEPEVGHLLARLGVSR